MGGEGYLFSDRQAPIAVEKLLNDALMEDPDFVWALILLRMPLTFRDNAKTK